LKAIVACATVCVIGLLTLGACSSSPEKPSSSSGVNPNPPAKWQPTALGEITADRCIYFGEAEDFKEKAGGDIDLKGGASKGKCLGNRWGDNLTDFATYDFELAAPSESTLLVLKTAFEGTAPHSYDVLVDGVAVQTAEIGPSGGWGYTEKEWKCTSIELGRIAQGRHTLTLKPTKASSMMNIDCFALGKAK
jgi:hypothetical protein